MTKPKRRGFSLVRDDAKGPSSQAKSGSGDGKSELARIRTKKVFRGRDGKVIDLTPQEIGVCLAQFEPLTQILLEEPLESEGYAVKNAALLQKLPELLEKEKRVRLVVMDARAVGQQVPYIQKTLLPQLDALRMPHMILGTNAAQRILFAKWYKGRCVDEGDLKGLIQTIKLLIGPGLRR